MVIELIVLEMKQQKCAGVDVFT